MEAPQNMRFDYTTFFSRFGDWRTNGLCVKRPFTLSHDWFARAILLDAVNIHLSRNRS